MGSMRRSAIAVAVLAALLLSGCATTRVLTDPPGDLPEPRQTIAHGERHGTEVTQPGPFVVRYDDTELHLEPFTYCYSSGFSGGCVDGFDEHPPSVGSPDELLVFVPVSGFTSLSATQFETDTSTECGGRYIDAETTELGDGWWRVRPNGTAGDYQVDLFASGDGAGDMAASLMWTTTSDGVIAEPEASLTLIVDHDGAPDSYGLELYVVGLAETPATYSAWITVTASNDASAVIEATPAEGCQPEGSIFFDGPAAAAEDAAELGPFPFTYRVELSLDGATYVGTGIYPDDVAGPNEIAVPLEFTPALP